MENRFSFSGLLILASLITLSLAQANDDSNNSTTAIKVNAVSGFLAQREDVVILDVRTPIEYEMSHITGSVNVDVGDDSFDARVATLDSNKTYIVHCTKNPAGGRSSRALETLKNLGFKHLYSLEGGYIAWKDAELPLTEPSN
ncbi:MAG: rhodanese-like domain-containing protein [Proteobacteria bacterium]|nr:rhodanese-like domain-containing protein [Pseudomonadota bacterium]